MKKKLFLFITLINIIILTGCVDTDITLDIDKKGNAIIYSDILIKDSLFENISKEELEELKTTYDGVEKITSQGKSGYRITDKLGKISSTKNGDLGKLEGADEFKRLIDVKRNKELFYDTYEVKIKIKDYLLESKNKESNKKVNQTVLGVIGSSTNINFHLKIPIQLLQSNATSQDQKDSRYIYNWDYTLDNMDNIHVSVKVPNIKNMTTAGVMGISIIGLVVLFIIRMKKRTRMD